MFDDFGRVAGGPDGLELDERACDGELGEDEGVWSPAEEAERAAWLAAESAAWAAIRQAGGLAVRQAGGAGVAGGGPVWTASAVDGGSGAGDAPGSDGERRGPWWAGLEPGAGLGTVLAEVRVAELGDFDLVEFVAAVELQRRHLDGVFAGAVAELAGRPVFERCADCDPDAPDAELTPHGKQGHDPRVAAADEISPALGWTPGYATSQVEQAVDLAVLLPATLAALRAGRIDAYRARIIWEQTQPLANRPALRARVEAAGLAVAGSKTAPALREFLKRKLAALDPAGAERRRKTARRSREVSKPRPDGDGMASMAVYGPVEDLAAFWTALDAAARARRDAAAKDAAHQDAGVSLAALRFDVVADLGYAALACGHLGCCNPDCVGAGQRLGARQGKQANVTVRMGAGTAAGIDSLPAVVEGFGTITAEAARVFAADATWRRLLTDPVSSLSTLLCKYG
jgi:hypothetical protein